MRPQQFKYNTPPSEGVCRAVFLPRGRVKAETPDFRQFFDPNWLAKNYFE